LRWAGRVYSAIDTLQTLPRRYGFAPEQVYVDYELRALVIGDYLALYHVDDLSMTVRVLGFRHGARLPRADDLPDQPPLS